MHMIYSYSYVGGIMQSICLEVSKYLFGSGKDARDYACLLLFAIDVENLNNECNACSADSYLVKEICCCLGSTSTSWSSVHRYVCSHKSTLL